MNNGRVYWITSDLERKRTIVGTMLYYSLKRKRGNVIILDEKLVMKCLLDDEYDKEYSGDIVRKTCCSKLAKLLSDQGEWVVLCTDTIDEKTRNLNRKSIKGYIEVAIDRYNIDDSNLKSKSDIYINVDTEVDISELITSMEKIVPENEDDYDRDRIYWNNYYKDIGEKNVEPSLFAKEIERRLDKEACILELGCGNGRDSLFFHRNGHSIIAVDGSNYAIDMLNDATKNERGILFACDDFVKCHMIYRIKYDCIYSRFTLHAITEEQENELLMNIQSALKDNGIFCVEARTIHDSIYGLGEKVAENAFIYNDHFRRFIDVNVFESKIRKMGFKIISLQEGNGFSPSEDSDPILMRCIVGI